MIDVRLLKNRVGGAASVFLLLLIWLPSSSIGTDTAFATAPAASALWLAPSSTGPRETRDPDVGGYALLYLGRGQIALNKFTDAAATADRLLATQPAGYLGEAALWLSADVAEAADDWPRAVRSLQALVASNPLEPERANLRLGRAAIKANDRALALSALTKVYYEFALSPEADDAASELAKLNAAAPTRENVSRDLTRAQEIYGAKRYAAARAAFVSLRGLARGEDRSLVDLRIGAADYFLKRYAAARDELRPLLDEPSPQRTEAEFLYFSTLRGLGRHEEYLTRARAFIDAYPTHPLAEETLSELATHYVLANDDGKAAEVLTELYDRFPSGVHADRAAWRAGWWDYKSGAYAQAIRVFESAAITFPHDDYRPLWLYWAARAHLRLGDRTAAIAVFRQVVADYRNSYYGRQATRAMEPLLPGRGQVSLVRREAPTTILPGAPPPNAATIRGLLAVGLYDTAILEVRKAELEFGASPLLEATMAYALNRKGDLRPAITTMRHAYPQFLAEGGESLPEEIRRVIFPIAYWDLISKYAAAQHLDPFLMAALVAQESTFQPDVKSVAGAWGLMQIEPGTGRQYAAKLRIQPFSTARLKQPEVNVRIGMATFADSMVRFGSVAGALAAYNAGDSRVARWLADRRGLEQDEFIDDIPFPETQNYVKRILGTAEDYRLLYPELKSPQATKKPGQPGQP